MDPLVIRQLAPRTPENTIFILEARKAESSKTRLYISPQLLSLEQREATNTIDYIISKSAVNISGYLGHLDLQLGEN